MYEQMKITPTLLVMGFEKGSYTGREILKSKLVNKHVKNIRKYRM